MYTELMLAERWLDTLQVAETVKLQTQSAVPAGNTTDATWAGPLAPYLGAEAITLLRGLSIHSALEARGILKVPLHVTIPIETGAGITGGWVTEGSAIPVQKTAFATSVEEHHCISIASAPRPHARIQRFGIQRFAISD